MSSTEVRKNSKAKANLVAFWEWFKSAAWLQVLLIVGVVVAVVVSIPYIIRAIPTESDSQFYESHQITYDKLTNEYIPGKSDECKGGIGNTNGAVNADSGLEGFVLLVYKDNCANCSSMEGYIESWYNTFNEQYNANLKFFSLNVGWVPGDEEACSEKEGKDTKGYENDYITLDQQNILINELAPVYYNLPDYYHNSSFSDTNEEAIIQDVIAAKTTVPTPIVVQYTRAIGSTGSYEPTKVFIGQMGSLSVTNRDDVSKMLQDIYNIWLWKGTN